MLEIQRECSRIIRMAREILEKTKLESDESIVLLNMKDLYIKFPLKEAIDIAMRILCEQTNSPKLSRQNYEKKSLNCENGSLENGQNGLSYVEKDGIFLGAYFA